MPLPTYAAILAADQKSYFDQKNMGVPKLLHSWAPFVDGAQYNKMHAKVFAELANMVGVAPVDFTTIGDFDNSHLPNATRDALVKAAVNDIFAGFKPYISSVWQAGDDVTRQILAQIVNYVVAGDMGTTPSQVAANIALLNGSAQTP